MVQVMPISLFLMILMSLACGIEVTESANPSGLTPTETVFACGGVLLALTLLIHSLGVIAKSSVTQNRMSVEDAGVLLARRLEKCHWLAVGMVVLCLEGLGLSSVLVSPPWIANSLAMKSLALLFPGMSLFLFSVLTNEKFSIAGERKRVSRTGILRLVLPKLSFISAISILPIVLLLGLIDVVQMLPIEPTYRSAATALIVILFIVSALPWLVSQSIGHSTLSGKKKKWIDELTERAGLGNTPVKIWRTNHRNMNAMAIGFISPFRTLFLSDQLVAELPSKQLAMVLLHEASHLKRQHLPIRLLCTIPIWVTAAAFSPWLEQHQGIASLTTVMCVVLTLIVLRWVAHQTEYDADAEACRLAVRISRELDGVPQTLSESSRELSRALLKVSQQRSIARKSTWMHPSVLTRIQNMRSHPHPEAQERGLVAEAATRMQAELTSAAC